MKDKIDEYKKEKNQKKIRKREYENFLKTEKVLRTRHFDNYKKWDMYDEESDEEKEPILPRHDPNFIALEKDMIETKKKRDISRKIAEALKDEANALMKELKFSKAITKYTEAIEEQKGIMSFYTNRALAYLKVENYDSAIKDCEKVIDYLEVFEEEKAIHKDLYVKAMIRKSIALSKLKEFDDSINLIKEAMKILTNEEIQKTYENILVEQELFKKANEVSSKLESDPAFKKCQE